jgi:chromosome segregation ATPase
MDIRLEIKEDIKDLTDKIHAVDNSLTEHKTHYALRANQIDQIQEQQMKTNEHLAEYNNQLTLHIAGVQELKSMNSNLIKYIHAIKDDIDKEFEVIEKRLEITEAPIKWWESTKSIVYITWSVIAAVAAAYAFYFQVWTVKPDPKPMEPVAPITKIIK